MNYSYDLKKKKQGKYDNSVNSSQNASFQQNESQSETDWVAEYDQYEASKRAATVNQPVLPSQSNQRSAVQNTASYEGRASAPATAQPEPAYNSQWKAELDGLMNKILNREKFEYNMNGDAMYQQMADVYQNQANLAMQNSMAQAAAMTGGYGSSYGQMVGQQAYAGQMQGLNEVGMDLYNQALNQYIAEGDALNQQYAMLADRETQAYNRGIDERNFEYQKALDDRTQANYENEFAYQQGRDTVADSQWSQNFDENTRQFNTNLEYQQNRDTVTDSQWDKTFEYQQGRDKVADEQWAESMQYQKDRDAVGDAQWDKSFGYQQNRDQVADEQWQAELDRYIANDETAREQWQAEMDRATANDKLAAEQWDKQFASSEEQRAADNAYRDKTFDYQQSRDEVTDSQWKAELDRMLANDEISQQQWQAEMARALANDKLASDQWEKSFAEEQRQYNTNLEYQQSQDALDNEYRDKTFAEEQRQYDESMQFQKDRAEVSDSQWQQELDRYLANDEIAAEQWNKQFAAEEEQRGIDNAYRDATLKEEQRQYDSSMDYQKERDAVDDNQWQQSFDYSKEQDTIANEQWEKSFAETQEQNDLDNEYRNAALEQDDEHFDENLAWEKELNEYMYGEDGFYATQSQLDREHSASENKLNREHDANMQNDAQDFTKSENALDRTHQTTLQNDAQAHDVSMQDDAQKHQSDMYDKEYDDMYGENGFYTKQNAQEQKNWDAQFQREGEWYNNAQTGATTTVTYEGGGVLNGQTVPAKLSGVSGLTTTRTSLFDEDGVFKKAAVVRKNTGEGQDGTITYNIDGKEITLQAGTNPYTNSVNPDAKSGTFDNGYQPNSVASWYPDENGNPDPKKGQLTKTNKTDTINGVEQNVWKTPDGYEWIWDGANNTYRPYGNNQKTPSEAVSSFLAGTGVSPSAIKYHSVK